MTATSRSAQQDAQYSELWSAFKERGDEGARKELIQLYWPLVKHVARKVQETLPPHATVSEDLESYGALGLIDAIDRFDMSRGTTFATFAVYRIKGAIYDGIRSEDWAIRKVRRNEREIKDARTRLCYSLGRMPTEREEADELGITVEDLRKIKHAISRAELFSLDAVGPEFQIHTGVEDEAFDAYIKKELAAWTREAIQQLKPNERTVLVMSFQDDVPLAQIGACLGVTESRVCQIRMAAIGRLRRMLPKLQEEALAGSSV